MDRFFFFDGVSMNPFGEGREYSLLGEDHWTGATDAIAALCVLTKDPGRDGITVHFAASFLKGAFVVHIRDSPQPARQCSCLRLHAHMCGSGSKLETRQRASHAILCV